MSYLENAWFYKSLPALLSQERKANKTQRAASQRIKVQSEPLCPMPVCWFNSGIFSFFLFSVNIISNVYFPLEK